MIRYWTLTLYFCAPFWKKKPPFLNTWSAFHNPSVWTYHTLCLEDKKYTKPWKQITEIRFYKQPWKKYEILWWSSRHLKQWPPYWFFYVANVLFLFQLRQHIYQVWCLHHKLKDFSIYRLNLLGEMKKGFGNRLRGLSTPIKQCLFFFYIGL